MMSLYSGTPGSGKSLHATKQLRDRIRYGYPVIANYPIKSDQKGFENFKYVTNEDLTSEFLYEFADNYWKDQKHFKEDRILLVIDEAQLLFNSRSWQSMDRNGWLQFFSQHRHMGYEIIMVAQNDRMLDRQIRCLFEYDCKHRKLGNFGWKGKIMALLAGGELFVVVKYFYSINQKLGVETFRPNRRIYQMYDTTIMFKRKEEPAQIPTQQAPRQGRDIIHIVGMGMDEIVNRFNEQKEKANQEDEVAV